MSRRFLIALSITAALSAALAGCATQPAAGPSTSAPTASETASETPSATPTPEPVALPSDCADIGTPETRAATVDQLNLQGDGVGFERPVPAGATLELGCDWFAGDTTGVLLLISRVDPQAATDFIPTLEAEGYTCTTGDAGNPVCQMTTPNSEYPVDTVETIVSREDVWIYMSATNVDGDLLLSDLNQQIWG